MPDDHPCSFIREDGRFCSHTAEWRVQRNNGDPYDYVEACAEHVAEFLDPEYVNAVTWINVREEPA